METIEPTGDSQISLASTIAQDCWICADVAIRAIADPAYRAGPAIEYALEPVIHHATLRLFGVTQLGSDMNESVRVAAVLAESDVASALEFCDSATRALVGATTVNRELLSDLEKRASALLPGSVTK
jgi:hypothetical protein